MKLGLTPVSYDYDDGLRENQKKYFETLEVRNMLDQIREIYTPHFVEYLGAEEEAHNHYDDPHAKRELRIQAMDELRASGDYYTKCWTVRKPKSVLKKNEWAKHSKLPRAIVDLGVPSSLAGFRTTEYFKKAMATEPIYYKGGMIDFCKAPTFEKLKYVFAELIRPTHRFYFVYFSDDSCVAINVGGRILRANLDISSCDASHTRHLFRALHHITPDIAKPDVDNLIAQCEAKLSVQSTGGMYKATYGFTEPRLYSGSTLTTTINNLANIAIALSIANLEHITPETIVGAAAKVGYIITFDECQDWHQLQFLKNSPVRDSRDGAIVPALNVGVVLRLSGTCKGDLPGRGDIKRRAADFQASLLQGAIPRVHTPFTDLLKSRVGGEAKYDVSSYFEYKTIHQEDIYVTTKEYFRRYEIPEYDLDYLFSLTAEAGFGTLTHCRASDMILQKDYELGYLDEIGRASCRERV